jgi:hypothetical protein
VKIEGREGGLNFLYRRPGGPELEQPTGNPGKPVSLFLIVLFFTIWLRCSGQASQSSLVSLALLDKRPAHSHQYIEVVFLILVGPGLAKIEERPGKWTFYILAQKIQNMRWNRPCFGHFEKVHHFFPIVFSAWHLDCEVARTHQDLLWCIYMLWRTSRTHIGHMCIIFEIEMKKGMLLKERMKARRREDFIWPSQ